MKSADKRGPRPRRRPQRLNSSSPPACLSARRSSSEEMALSALSREASASTASASSADDAAAPPRRARRDADDADAPRLPLRRRQTTQPEPRGARAWLAAAGDHPVLAAVGAVLTVMLPTRVASTLHSYASHYNLVEDAPRPPLTRSSGTPGEDFGFCGHHAAVARGRRRALRRRPGLQELRGRDAAARRLQAEPPDRPQTSGHPRAPAAAAVVVIV